MGIIKQIIDVNLLNFITTKQYNMEEMAIAKREKT
jgi:hypothetical protein